MQTNRRQMWRWKSFWFAWCMMISLSPTWAQSFAEALQAGQSIQVEWIQQELTKSDVKDRPLFPDELKIGESEIRIGLNLKSAGNGDQLLAEVTYVSYLSIPEPENNAYPTEPETLLSEPIILDTRFQDEYFNPQLYLLDILTQQVFPISCKTGDYQKSLNQFEQEVEQYSAASNLVQGQLEWLERTSLSSSLSASSMASFFCQLLKTTLPQEESPFKLQSRKQGEIRLVDYLQVDYPPKRCLLKGKIQSPATDQVRVKFFRQGNWLEYWRDSIIQLDAEGNFQLAFSLDHPETISVFHGYQSMRFYLEPGDSLQFSTNANAFYREMQVEGDAEEENEFLLDFYHQMRGDTLYGRYDFDLLEKDHLAYFQKVQAQEGRELNFLSQRAPILRPGFTTFMDRSLKLEHANTQWEAGYRFMVGKRVVLEPELLRDLQKKASLLYRLPPQKGFDFDVEEFLSFQYYLLQNAYHPTDFDQSKDFILAQLLPSKETFVRHALMQLFRNYSDLGRLTESGQWRLSQLMAITKDTQLIQEMQVFTEGTSTLAPDYGYRILQRGKAAPFWSFENNEGVKVELKDFSGEKLLLHIGWADNLDVAMTDIQQFKEAQDQLPEIVHLLTATSEDQFKQRIAGKSGLFVFVPPGEMEELAENYHIGNSSNHYFLIGEDGNVLANHYDLGTAQKIRGAWEKLGKIPPSTAWTPEQRLQFWQSLGIGALILLLITGGILWQRQLLTRRDLRRRQLLEIELRGIRSQMNPHFLFNAMSSIQNLIRKKEQEKADLYLGQFAGLMRKTLRNTAEEYIPLIDEIETLEQYCSLESLRHPFLYEFQIDADVDAYNTYIPSMILQPIIENAIIHGLAPHLGSKFLQVKIKQGQEGLNCSITDNGIGVLASQKHNERKNHQSFGMKLVRQRLELMGLNGEEHLSIIDRSTLNPPAQGTLVSITIPIEE